MSFYKTAISLSRSACSSWVVFAITGVKSSLGPEQLVDPAAQLSIVLELMVARLRLDYASPRYLDLCRAFSNGLQIQKETNRAEMGYRYSLAYRNYYAPFMQRYEYLLEHYLVSYAFKTLFPFGSPSIQRLVNGPNGLSPFVSQYLLMASYFSIANAILIGLAAHYQSAFAPQHVLLTIQLISKMLEHCETFPARLLEILASRGIKDCAGMSVLTQN